MDTKSSTPSLPTYGLPIFDGDPDGKKPLLLVYLTSLDEAAEAKLTQLLQPALGGEDGKLHRWNPPPSVLKNIAYPNTPADNTARLYAVSILAYRAGWSGLIVADNLTKRQLDGTTKFGEGQLPTVVLISVKPRSQSPSPSTDHVRVVAKRTTGWEGESADIPHLLETIEPAEVSRLERIYTGGMILHDPDRRVFTPGIASVREREDLSDATYGALARLPNELVDDILTRARDNGEVSQFVEKLPSWKKNDEEHLSVFLLFPATPEELESLRSMIQGSVQALRNEGVGGDGAKTPEVRLVPLEHHGAKSRTKLQNLWDRYQFIFRSYDIFVETLCFLPEPIKDPQDIHLGVCYDTYLEFPLKICRKPLRGILKWLNEFGLHDDVVEYPDNGDGNTELLLRPQDPFYANPPVWTLSRLGFESTVIFYLTNKLADEQDKNLRDELYRQYHFDIDDDYQLYCFVPWKSGHRDEPDGNLDDMWEIYRNSVKGGGLPVFCIDQQSAVDGKVIALVSEDTAGVEENGEGQDGGVENSELKRMYYGRVPAAAASSVQDNLRSENMEFDEIVEQENESVQVYRRPG